MRIRRAAIGMIMLVASAVPPANGQKSALKKTPADKAVETALVFLANTQNRGDGSWTGGRSGKSVAVTSLGVMAFLSAGHVPGEGAYGKAVSRGVKWVLSQQQPNGLLATDFGHEMYHHGIATLMLAEVCAMLPPDEAKDARKALEKAVTLILKAQRTEGVARGGWRYTVAHLRGSDMSVTGWQVMALRAAKNVGCDVPASAIERAVAYIKRSQDARTGAFSYTADWSQPTVPCTGTGVLALELCGKGEHRSDMVVKGAAYLLRAENLPKWNGPYFFYGLYYGSQATFQVGDTYWSGYRSRMHETLLENQSSSGSWVCGTEAAYGAPYCTAMAVLALTVEYRFLPIYQREEANEK